jgi:Transcription elongation factor
MNHVFVREDGSHQTPPDTASSERPNYVTPAGLAQLRARQQAARARHAALEHADTAPSQEGELALLERQIRWLDQRVGSAIEVDLMQQPRDRVAFGATVTVGSREGERRWQIVGEDEADVEHGRVSYCSPLAQALLGASVGDEVLWPRPAGDLSIEVLSIDYLTPDDLG